MTYPAMLAQAGTVTFGKDQDTGLFSGRVSLYPTKFNNIEEDVAEYLPELGLSIDAVQCQTVDEVFRTLVLKLKTLCRTTHSELKKSMENAKTAKEATEVIKKHQNLLKAFEKQYHYLIVT